jgi:hypothetical protein
VRWHEKPLIPSTVQELGFLSPDWRRQVAGTAGMLSSPTYWAPIGLTTVAIWPTPPGISYITCTGLALPPAIDPRDGMDRTVDLSPEWQDPVLDLATWWAAGKGGAGMQQQYQPHLDRALAGISAYLGTQVATQIFAGLTFARAGTTQRVPQPVTPPAGSEGGAA